MKVAQVKEKFGDLRFYVDSASERQQALIDDAQARSFRVCEICGAPGLLMRETWMRTRCADHVLLNSFEHGQMRAL
ncbi:hypothetical protein [Dokdonella sp.]|uniref:hypothetical protein n=1 Tax=Dokdonella sp. TaxID=2291710 RepID=UPI002D801532|nr:hypothetical protein [Dokdonella sp.]